VSEKGRIVLLLSYLQRRIEKECRGRDYRCALEVIESVKTWIEESAMEEVERMITR